METTASNETFATGMSIPWWRIITLGVLGVAVLGICQVTRPPNESTEEGVIMDLPIFVESFMGTDAEPSLAEITMLPKDTEFRKKIYNTLQGNFIVCQVVLSGGEKRSIHRPEICLPGQGWTIADRRPISVKLDNGATQKVMKLILEREIQTGPDERRKISTEFMYWFVGKDKTTADTMDRILYSSWDRVMHNVNHRWAYVIVSAMVPPQAAGKPDAHAATVEMLKAFIGRLAPQIQKPDVVSG